jgi:hypothetical protein
MAVRTAGTPRQTFVDLASNADDPNEPDDSPTVFPFASNLPSLPAAPVAMAVGTMVNRYSAANDWDWFTFTLP